MNVLIPKSHLNDSVCSRYQWEYYLKRYFDKERKFLIAGLGLLISAHNIDVIVFIKDETIKMMIMPSHRISENFEMKFCITEAFTEASISDYYYIVGYISFNRTDCEAIKRSYGEILAERNHDLSRADTVEVLFNKHEMTTISISYL